ncbi:suppressor of deletion of TFIIS [Spiromyces aspiralis]|uniref:Suppressor of deletion of TFIIS n=1 Tax=Spiromyces aspiralis TaxID=68401 RepID=A0ACC1HBW9_9FUNG|nr:suppressor of deletion of TFIIS [Spiromyces aspiralis]
MTVTTITTATDIYDAVPVTTEARNGSGNDSKGDQRPILFLDIDNCLYSPDYNIHIMMSESHDWRRQPRHTEELCLHYYVEYGLAIRGLIKFHHKNVDLSLPLEDILKDDPVLRDMLERIDARIWAFTNANLPHAQRVLKCLGISHLIEGITYCNYSEVNFPCKPGKDAYLRALEHSGAKPGQKCYLVDDSAKNIIVAREMGWTGIHCTPTHSDVGNHQIGYIHDLLKVVPELEKKRGEEEMEVRPE